MKEKTIDKLVAPFATEWIEQGTVTTPRGFKASVAHAGFSKTRKKPDIALIVADDACPASGVFTKNAFAAAPVQLSKLYLAASEGHARAVALNSVFANAATGEEGMNDATTVATALGLDLKCDVHEVLLASTGVIGQRFDKIKYLASIPQLIANLSENSGHDAAQAIMTTDTRPKEAALKIITKNGQTFTIGGIAKGSGMIAPNMATMLSVITTDANLSPDLLSKAHSIAVNKSFNRLTVDGDTSTNDTCYLLASGASNSDKILDDTPEFNQFCSALTVLCQQLAREMAFDGEGATKLITVNIKGGRDEHEAEMAARKIATSSLVKTAIAGRDANWGRIASSLGNSDVFFNPENVTIELMDTIIFQNGAPQKTDEEEISKLMEAYPEITITCNLHVGDANATFWTCDLTKEYISINADYRS